MEEAGDAPEIPSSITASKRLRIQRDALTRLHAGQHLDLIAAWAARREPGATGAPVSADDVDRLQFGPLHERAGRDEGAGSPGPPGSQEQSRLAWRPCRLAGQSDDDGG
jgi:hypothetical protein